MSAEDKSWKELSSSQQNAATVLGYTRQLWDNDEETSITKRSWSKLTSEQRDAAKILGYTRSKWDSDDDGSDDDESSSSYSSAEKKQKQKEAQKHKGAESSSPSGEAEFDVVIVGGGFAGLTCALELLKARKSVVILEARDRLGGRACTVSVGGDNVDSGCQWIHGHCAKHPVSQHVKELGIPIKATDWDSTSIFQASGKEVGGLKSKLAERGYLSLMKKVKHTPTSDGSLGSALQILADKEKMSQDERLLLFHMAMLYIEDEYNADIDDIDQMHWDSDEDMDEKADDFMVLGPGYSGIVNAMAARLKGHYRLGSIVERITWDHPGRVSVQVAGAAAPITARAAVIAVPLGVLKRKSIAFSPALPESKATAIERIGMGVFNKVILKFSQNFWGKTPAFTIASHEKNVIPLWVSMVPHSGANILIGYSFGRFGTDLQHCSDDEIISKALSDIRVFAPKMPADIRPEAYHITRWGLDPFAYGSYSYPKVGSSSRDRREIQSPLSRTLYFAGEHTHTEFPTTAHGAMMSGEIAASQILKEL